MCKTATLKKPKISFQYQLSLNAGQTYCRMLQGEHSAILLAFIKLPFVTKIFVLSIFERPFYTGFTVCAFFVSNYFVFKMWCFKMNSIWLEPLSTLFIVYICAHVANIIARLRGCADLSEPWSLAGAKRTKLPRGNNGLLKSNILTYKQIRKLKKVQIWIFQCFPHKGSIPTLT